MKLVSFMVLFTKKSVEAGYLTESDNLDVIIKETMPEDDEHSMNYRINVQCKLEFDVIEGFNITDFTKTFALKHKNLLDAVARAMRISEDIDFTLAPVSKWLKATAMLHKAEQEASAM